MIDKERGLAIVEAFRTSQFFEQHYGTTEAETESILNILTERIKDITSRSKMGHWIVQDIHNCHTNFRCSECGYIHSFMHLYGKLSADYTYCPNCGAKMG